MDVINRLQIRNISANINTNTNCTHLKSKSHKQLPTLNRFPYFTLNLQSIPAHFDLTICFPNFSVVMDSRFISFTISLNRSFSHLFTDMAKASANGTVIPEHNMSLHPYFNFDVQRNVTARVGQTAFLQCKVEQLGDKSVSLQSFSCSGHFETVHFCLDFKQPQDQIFIHVFFLYEGRDNFCVTFTPIFQMKSTFTYFFQWKINTSTKMAQSFSHFELTDDAYF